jgi:pyruvate formate lyase activating enzyme
MRDDATGVAGWIKNSFIDFPGTVSTVLFFSGCNLRCPYCHNPHLLHDGPLPDIPLRKIVDFLEKRRGIITGVVLSGGEPTLHATAANIADTVREMGCAVKLDTNGMLPEKIPEIKPDYLALDVKTLPALYGRMLKAPYADAGERLKESLAIARGMNESAEIRITIAPGIINKQIVEELGPMMSGIKKVYLQPMQTKVPLLDPAIAEAPQIPGKEISLYREILSRFVGKCEIRGEEKNR